MIDKQTLDKITNPLVKKALESRVCRGDFMFFHLDWDPNGGFKKSSSAHRDHNERYNEEYGSERHTDTPYSEHSEPVYNDYRDAYNDKAGH